MRRSTLALAAAMLSTVLSGAVANAAPGDLIVKHPDPVGDVKLRGHDGGLSLAQRRSIDMRKVTVKEQSGAVRFTVKIRQLTTSEAFDQIVEVRLLPTTDDAFWSTTVGFSPQHRTASYALYSPTLDGDDVVSCDPLTAVVRKARRTVSVDVPNKCLPKDLARIKFGTYTGHFRSEGVGYSLDRRNVPGAYDLR